jgi:hypothetical protein
MKHAGSILMVVLLTTALVSCAVAPSEYTVKRAITDFFEKGRYKVVDLKIGKIEGVPFSDARYMGTPGYVVEVLSITLEAQADKGSDMRKGDQMTFAGARIRVRQDIENKDVWHVSVISGINVT